MTDITFNVLEHELVPEHYLLTEEEAEKMLKELRISRDQLPKIRIDDACIKVLERVYNITMTEGRIVKIVRRSSTADSFVVYRLVVKR